MTYRLSGPDSASFSVATGSGQLRTLSGITYDFEDNDRYSVDLVGSDPYGESATIGVTIHVDDVDEPPEIPAAPLVQPASTTSLTVTWDAPDNTGPDITDYDVQIRKSGNFLPHSHDGPGTSATIIELDVNTRYEVQVRATNDEGTSEWSQSGEGRTNTTGPPGKPDPPTLTASFPLTLRIQWTAPENSGSTPITGYKLQYGKDGGQLEEYFRVFTDTETTFRSQPPGTDFEIQVRAINDEGAGEWSDSATGTTFNEPPTVTALDDRALTVGGGAEIIRLIDGFNDTQHGIAWYAAASNNNAVATVRVAGDHLTIRPVAAGNTSVEITAHDEYGLIATQTIDVSVQAATLPNPVVAFDTDDEDLTIQFTDRFEAEETRASRCQGPATESTGVGRSNPGGWKKLVGDRMR